ncbi:MAG: PDZ domain-containing protein, partial [Clostridia bacterium]|nr:PDZ domain-containing protein [Clostridia bacterium]
RTKGAAIIKLTEVVTEGGVTSPSANAGLYVGDVLLTVNGVDITCADDVTKALKGYNGGAVIITILRDGLETIKEITPALDLGGKYRLGVILRDGTSGIGTMTFIDGSKNFMALGHPICADSGSVIKINSGSIYRCSIFGVNKGEKGRAGELKGMFINDATIGSLTKNTEQGIVGKMNDSFDLENLPLIETGKAEIGKASIVTCVDGVIPKEYEIAIVKSDESKGIKNLVIKVTDKELLSVAGGIVQGMSGSPIVQSGKLVGAITHVFVNDSTRGYGISIENMLEVVK